MWIESTPIFRNIIGDEELEKEILKRYEYLKDTKKIFEEEVGVL